MWRDDDGHSAVSHHLVDKYSDGEMELVLVERRMANGESELVVHVEPKTFTSSGIQWTHFLEWLGFRYFNNCPYVQGRRCLWKKWDSQTPAQQIAQTLKEAYRLVKEADRLLSETPLKLPESNSGWLYFFVPEDMERYDSLMRLLAEL